LICLAAAAGAGNSLGAGLLGAWLLTGPTPTAEAARAAAVSFSSGVTTSARWTVESSNGGPLDVKKALKPGSEKGNVYATAAGVLRIGAGAAGRYWLGLGVDDGVELYVDGKRVFARDEARPERDDDDVVPLDLSAGEHPVALVLHQRDGAWSFHVRLLDHAWRAPRAACLALPGTTEGDARRLLATMSQVTFERGVRGLGYAPHVVVRFPEGAPLDAPLDVRVKLEANAPGARGPATVFDVDPGPFDLTAPYLRIELPALTGEALAAVEKAGAAATLSVELRGRDPSATHAGDLARTVHFPFSAREASRLALGHAWAALAAHPSDDVELLTNELARRVDGGDVDLESQAREAEELDRLAARLAAGEDPEAGRRGPMTRGYRSRFDGKLHQYGLYIPPVFHGDASGTSETSDTKKWPLVVGLHGMNGLPLAMLRWMFGGDDPKRDQPWESRHLDLVRGYDAFVVTPDAFGNSMYREMGEEDVLDVMAAVEKEYPIDRTRVTMTGLSMGGIGAAAIPLHHPGVFAASEPLCGYHSYFVRRDFHGRVLRPWEHLLSEERSNVEWADNGQWLPLYIVHGTMDQPVANSDVLIDRYRKLKEEHGAGYDEIDEHPNKGHNVWSGTYENLAGLDWLRDKRLNPSPKHVHLRTVRLRDGDYAWVHVVRFSAPDAWGEVDATASAGKIEATTHGVDTLKLDRPVAVGPGGEDEAVRVRLDGQELAYSAGEALVAHREGSVTATWAKGPSAATGWKEGHVTGPLRDVFDEPLLFVYGASDPEEAALNERVARGWAHVRGGMNLDYPVMSDREFRARGEKLDGDRALFLVGRAETNELVRALEPELPIRIEGKQVLVGDERIDGEQLGAAFVRPNPRRKDRYVVVVEGVDARATLRSLSLPDLLPDFAVYDAEVAPARGQLLLNAGKLREAGFFGVDWSLPPRERRLDPLAKTERPGATSEHDATPYLP
jgi:poly(3-hydroxybutyrate) depolymerase